MVEHKNAKNEEKEKLNKQYVKALLFLTNNCKDIATLFDIIIIGFKFLKNEEDKKKIREKIVNFCSKENIDSLETITSQIEKINDFELYFELRNIYEQQLLAKNEIIHKNEIEAIDENIKKINSLMKKLIIESSKEKMKNTLVELYINKGNIIENKIVNLTNVNEIEKESKNLDIIKESLLKIKAPKRALEYLDKLKATSNSYKNMIKGKEYMVIQDYKSAIKLFNDIKTDKELFQIEELKNICNLSLGKALENEKKYEEAIKYYKNIKISKSGENENQSIEEEEEIQFDVERMNILIFFEKAKKYLENNEYDKSIQAFVEMYKIRKRCKNQIEENIFTISLEPFLYVLSLETFRIYELDSKNEFQLFEKYLENMKNTLKDKLIEKNILEIINFIKDVNDLGKDELISHKILNENNINTKLSEMLQRIYIEILLSLLTKSKDTQEKSTILKIILKFVEENLYISKINIIKLRALFSLDNKNDKGLLPLISKLYYYFTNKGLEYEKNILVIIGNTIHSIDKEKRKKKSIYSKEEYNEIMKYLFLSLEKLIKEKEYNLTDVSNKIYEKILESEKNNPEIMKVLINGYYYFGQKNLILNSKTIQYLIEYLNEKEKNNMLFEVVLSGFKKNIDKYTKQIPDFFKLIFKYQKYESDILEILTSFEIPLEILNNQDFHKYIDVYISKENINEIIFRLIDKISTSYRTSKMIEKSKNKDIEKKNSLNELKPEIDKRELKLKEYNELIECGINLDCSQLYEIENNIDLKGFIELLILILSKQKDLIEKVHLEIISRFFCKKNYSLFKIISNQKRIWNEKSLYIIAKGLGKNNENEKKLILDFFEEIQKYQNIPKAIIDNLNIEKTIKKYENVDIYGDRDLIKILEEFKNIKNFSQKYLIILNKHILNYINSPNKIEEEQNIIIEKIFELLKTSKFNVSNQIIEFCIDNISINEFINNYSQILSNTRISHRVKKIIFDKILNILKTSSKDIQLQIIKEIKYFIDWEPLSNDLFSYLINLMELSKENDFSEISREILFVFGIIVSDKNKDKISKEFMDIICKIELFNLIMKNIENLKIQSYIYILGYVIYSNNKIIEKYDNFPRNFLINVIKQKLNSENKNTIFMRSLEYFEKFHEFDIFSPKRDKYLRKLIYNKKFNIEKISEFLIGNCIEENKIEKIEGEIFNGKIFGYGKIYYTNGDYYSGFFINNIKEGDGMFFSKQYPKGIQQTWKNGILIK